MLSGSGIFHVWFFDFRGDGLAVVSWKRIQVRQPIRGPTEHRGDLTGRKVSVEHYYLTYLILQSVIVEQFYRCI